MIQICGRKVKVQTGTKSQTVNICSTANIHGEYDYIVRLHPPFISTETLLRESFSSIEDLVRYLERHHHGEIEQRRAIQSSGEHILEGVEAIGDRYRRLPERDGLFELIYEQIRTNWIRYREQDRWPTIDKNWVLRVAPEFTYDPIRRREKQLQKEIAIGLENEGWGNDVPTASGLVNSRGRGINIDLGHRISDGFELIELKIESNTPYGAALQILRYGAIYMLYRLEPELARRFKSNEMIRAKRITLEALAPYVYYSYPDVDLQVLEMQLDREVATFARNHASGLSLSFRFMALPPEFIYRPGMDGESIREAVRHRASPFLTRSEPQGSLLADGERMRSVDITGHAGQPIRSFSDWEEYSPPPERKVLHWKEGRSAFELGRSWTISGEPSVPPDLVGLLESHEGTMRTVIKSGITEHETTLPFVHRGPRCHDLALRADRDDSVTTICIEAKADEPFGRTVAEELRTAKQRPTTSFPERLDWLTCSLLGIPAFKDDNHLVLSDVISGLPYQLLSAIAGTLLEAEIQKATTAVFLVHEFRTSATADTKLQANADALNSFLGLFQSVNGGLDEDVQLRPRGDDWTDFNHRTSHYGRRKIALGDSAFHWENPDGSTRLKVL